MCWIKSGKYGIRLSSGRDSASAIGSPVWTYVWKRFAQIFWAKLLPFWRENNIALHRAYGDFWVFVFIIEVHFRFTSLWSTILFTLFLFYTPNRDFKPTFSSLFNTSRPQIPLHVVWTAFWVIRKRHRNSSTVLIVRYKEAYCERQVILSQLQKMRNRWNNCPFH